MLALGWMYDDANPHELVIREGTYFSMKEVGMSGTHTTAVAGWQAPHGVYCFKRKLSPVACSCRLHTYHTFFCAAGKQHAANGSRWGAGRYS